MNDKKSISRTTLWVFVLIIALYALDQVTKWYIVMHYRMPDPILNVFLDGTPVLSDNSILHFNIIRIHNTGVAFGLGNGTIWAPYVFLGVQVIALVALIWLYAKNIFATKALKVAWGFIMVGVLGNMTDRLVQGFFLPGVEGLGFFDKLRLGYVVDFLDFSFPWIPTEAFPHGYHWPTFNVADSCVCIAAAIFIITSFFMSEPKPEQPKAEEGSETH